MIALLLLLLQKAIDIIFSNHPSGSQNLRVSSHKSAEVLIEETAAWYKFFCKSLRDGVNKGKVLSEITSYVKFFTKRVEGRKAVLLCIKEVVNFENSCATPMLQVHRFLIRLNKLIIPNYLFKNIIFAFWVGSYYVLPKCDYFVIKSWKAFASIKVTDVIVTFEKPS